MKFRRNTGLIWLCVMLCGFRLEAQEAAAASLAIAIMEGEGAVHNIRTRAGREAIVQVTDELEKPVADAAVVFTLPAQGPGGSFTDGSSSVTVMSDAQGRAVARGFRPNKATGKFAMRVNASWRGKTARTAITQFNMEVPSTKSGASGGKIAAIVLVLGAAAAGGAVAALRSSGSNGVSVSAPAASVPIAVAPGAGTIGPPQ